ncbi:MAG: YidC/Oxa1 family insertase periplasmic-domain containing protein, partial [Muribaculum sp.]|nr:YidC/Oxa1 family insertase periplasmic-domain containing protein [Muribaculum sp.]
MDKNTLLGALLMGAILLGFMWLNQPDPNAKGPMPEIETTENQNAANAAALLASSTDSVSTEEITRLASLIERYGQRDSTGTTSIATAIARLSTTDGKNLSGEVAGDNGQWISVSDLAASSLKSLPTVVADSAVASFKTTLRQFVQYQGFAPFLNGSNDTLRLENSVLALTFSTRGAMITEAELKKYDSFRGGNVKVINGDNDSYSFILAGANREFDTRDLYFKPVEVTDSSVTMALYPEEGSVFALRYTLQPDSYVVRLDLLQQGMDNILPSSTATMDFVWNQTMQRQEQGRMFEERNSGLYYKSNGGDVDNLSESADKDKEVSEPVKWIAFKNQFFSMAFIANGYFNRAELSSRVLPHENADYLKDLSVTSTFDYSTSSATPASFDILIGPNLYPM